MSFIQEEKIDFEEFGNFNDFEENDSQISSFINMENAESIEKKNSIKEQFDKKQSYNKIENKFEDKKEIFNKEEKKILERKNLKLEKDINKDSDLANLKISPINNFLNNNNNKIIINNKKEKNEKLFCKLHENEEIGDFYCFDCNNNSICLQCLVKSLHKNHNIMNNEKAKSFIKNKVDSFKEKICKKKNSLELRKDEIGKNVI